MNLACIILYITNLIELYLARKYFQTILFSALLLISSNQLLQAQKDKTIDSLQLLLKAEKHDTSKINILLKIAKHSSRFDLNITNKYLNQAKEIAAKLDDKQINADILYREAYIDFYSNEYNLALSNFKKALAIYSACKNKLKMAHVYYGMGNIYIEKNDFNKAIECTSKAEEIYNKFGKSDNVARCYIAFSNIYICQGKNHQALKILNTALKLANKSNQSIIARIKLNMFLAYYSLNEYKKALNCLDSIENVFIEEKDYSVLSNLYANCSSIYLITKDYDKARAYVEKSKYYAIKLNDLYSIVWADLMLASFYKETNKPDSAILILNKCFEENKKLNIPLLAENIYIYYSEAYEKKRNATMALEYYKKYTAVKDSIEKDLENKKIIEIQSQYEIDLKNEQIKFLAKEKQLVKLKNMLLSVALLIVIISGVFFFLYKNRKAKEKQLLHDAKLKEAEYKIDLKHRELTHKAIYASQQENIISNIREQLENLKIENSTTKATVLNLLSGIDQQLKQNSFEDFEKYFIEVHPEFYDKLKQIYSELTQKELKVCALIRLNLNSKQIADITGTTIRSVENSRYIIRKKMGLSLQNNLFEEISRI